MWVDGCRARTLNFPNDNATASLCAEEPQGFKSSVPPVTAVTAPTALVRMHGHNAEMWTKRVKTAAERFDYLYSEDELREWVPRVKDLASEAREVHVLMNNCHRDYSVRNARQIGEMLGVFGTEKSGRRDEQASGPKRHEADRPPKLL